MAITMLCHVDNVSYKEKPTDQAQSVQYRFKKTTEYKTSDFFAHNVDEVIKALENGQTIALANCEDRKKNKFKAANSAALDFDNGHSTTFEKSDPAGRAAIVKAAITGGTISKQEVIDRCREKGFAAPTFIYSTFSAGQYIQDCLALAEQGLITAEELDRIQATSTFRAVWVFDHTVNDPALYTDVCEKRLRRIFPESDPDFKIHGILFGTKYSDTIRTDEIVDITTIPYPPQEQESSDPEQITIDTITASTDPPPQQGFRTDLSAADTRSYSAMSQSDSQRRNIEVYLQFLSPSMLSDAEWINVANAMKTEGFSYSEFDNWCRLDMSRYDEAENRKRWDSLTPGMNTGGTIAHYANTYGHMTPEAFKAALYPQGMKPKHTTAPADFVAYNWDGTPEAPAGAAADQQNQKPAFGLVPFSAIKPQSVNWLWFPYIPRGKITLLTADPGTGKTFFALYLAACVSTGKPFWTDDRPYRQPENAIYQTAEDGYADTIVPRIMSMNCDRRHVFMINEETQGLSLKDSVDYIESVMKDTRPALLIFDPLQAYLGADVNMNAANEVRPVLSRIAKLADTYDTAVIFIMHLSKMSSVSKALYRALGSIDIPGASRSMLTMGKDPQDDSRRIICHEKSSLARNGQSLAFKIDPENGGVIFDGFSDLTANELLGGCGKREKPADALNKACDEILNLLGEEGYAEFKDIKKQAEIAGITRATLYRAKDELMLDHVTVGYGKDKKSYWLSGDIDPDEFKKARQAEVGQEPTETEQTAPEQSEQINPTAPPTEPPADSQPDEPPPIWETELF